MGTKVDTFNRRFLHPTHQREIKCVFRSYIGFGCPFDTFFCPYFLHRIGIAVIKDVTSLTARLMVQRCNLMLERALPSLKLDQEST